MIGVDNRERNPDKLWENFWSKERIQKDVEDRIPLKTPISDDKVRIVCISDTHEKLSEIVDRIPNGDILLHCGDFTNNGSKEAIEEFDRLMGTLPHPVKLVAAGNHELGFDDTEDESLRYEHDKGKGTQRGYELLKNVTILHDKLVEVCGLKIYGSSWHPLPHFAFSRSRGEEILKEWLKIPANIDILMTHTPPLGHRDHFNDIEGHWGCAELLQRSCHQTDMIRVDHREQNPNKLWENFWNKERIQKDVEDRIPLKTPISDDKVRIVCISDTHEKLGEIVDRIPNGDILLHCGDFTNNGSKDAIEEFDRLMGTLPHPVKLVVAGNHDLGFDNTEDESLRYVYDVGKGTKRGYELLKNVTVLHDQMVEVCGLKIYGSSWHPLPHFAFSRSRGEEILKEWLKIPADIDILMTHTPPLGHRDVCWNEEHTGCAELLQVVEEVAKPSLHVFGHIHEAYGISTNDVTTFVNASLCNQKLDPLVFDLPLKLETKDYNIYGIEKKLSNPCSSDEMPEQLSPSKKRCAIQ
ncbi:unnamed protein product [Bursaphelenchus xylophilus]|uniref:(pine wood nematode) hypothetical protein n=1 Tax=Bursaphelenchus xylophilus TaxID=6326 RepID=A0A1I7RSZ0_BURXY|nr:unnamed protein product [Bursaphelenchus xylophilus]CAG9122727.1 unnamed protein product [Bursaphelenchus xylophilus]